MSRQRNSLLPGAGTTSSGAPIVVELDSDSDSSDEDVEVSRYTGYPRIRISARLSRPPSTIDLESLCEMEPERRHDRSPLPSTSTGGQTGPILSTTFQNIKNHDDENPSDFDNALAEIRKMKEEENELKEKISSLEKRVAEAETTFSVKDAEVEQGQREIGILHQSLDKISADFKEKEEEAEKLRGENSSLQKTVDKTNSLFKDKKKEAEQLQERLHKITFALNDMIEENKQLKIKNTSIQQQLDASENALKIKEKETDQLQKLNSSLQQQVCKTSSVLAEKERMSGLMKNRIIDLKQRLYASDKALDIKTQETTKITDELTKQLQDSKEEVNLIRIKFEEEKVRSLDIQNSVDTLTTKLKLKINRINKLIELQKLSSQTESNLRQELSDVENKHKELNSLFSNLKQHGEELEKTLQAKNDMLVKVAEEKVEFERMSVSYHEDNERLRLKLKKLEEVKQQCVKLLTSSLEPAAAAGTSEASESALSCNDPPTSHPENNNSMDNLNDTGTSAVLLKSSHGVITRLSSGSLERRSVTTIMRGGIDAPTPKGTKTGPEFHKVDDSAKAGEYRCICSKVLVSTKALTKHIQTNSEGVLCNICFRTFETKAGLKSHVKSCPSNQSTPNEDVRIGLKRKRNQLPDDDAIP